MFDAAIPQTVDLMGDRASTDGRPPPSFTALLNQNGHRVLLFLELRMAKVLKLRISPEDLLHDVFLEALQCRENLEYRGERPFRNWLFTIAERKVAAACDRLGRQPKADPLREDPAGSSNAIPDRALVDSLTTASSAAMRNERQAALLRSLQRLTDDHREVVVLRKLQELPLKEIASRMGRSEGAAAMLLHRALIQLREELQREGVTESTTARPLK